MQIAPLSTYFCPTRIHLGAGAHTKLPELLASRNAQKIFLVVDPALREARFFPQLIAALDAVGCFCTVFSEFSPDPSSDSVQAAYLACTQAQTEAIVAIGGGSAIDVAKATGILAVHGGRIHDYEGSEKFTTAPLPLIAIPSTAGTGSEVSGSCVITDSASGRKMSIRHARLNPASEAILDPLVLTGLPANVAIHAGVDAFVHAFESFISLQANLITDAINLQAIEMISSNIRAFVADRRDLNAAQNMLVGACLAGMTFGQTGLGNVHCIARFIGAQFHLSHGLSNALVLPHVARFNLPAAQEKYARVAKAMGCAVEGQTTERAASLAIDAIAQLCRDLGIPERLRDAGVTTDALENLARDSHRADYSRWNPRATSEQDFLQLLNAAF